MRVHVLGSGSRGNAVVLESAGDRVLIDCGFGPRALGQRMKAVGVVPESISALIVTHEHSDHIGGVRAACRRWRWPVYATAGTLEWLPRAKSVASTAIEPRRELTIGDLTMRFVRTPHDASEPIGILATARSTGVRVGVIYDLGHVPPRLAAQLTDLEVLLLESNHDESMLRNGSYPRSVQNRIAGPHGHLSNLDAGRLARGCVHRGLRHLVLCHLSQNNNRPDVALQTMRKALRGTGFRGSLEAAEQDAPMSVGVPRGLAARQLSLDL